jgi:hypothetical protein
MAVLNVSLKSVGLATTNFGRSNAVVRTWQSEACGPWTT